MSHEDDVSRLCATRLLLSAVPVSIPLLKLTQIGELFAIVVRLWCRRTLALLTLRFLCLHAALLFWRFCLRCMSLFRRCFQRAGCRNAHCTGGDCPHPRRSYGTRHMYRRPGKCCCWKPERPPRRACGPYECAVFHTRRRRRRWPKMGAKVPNACNRSLTQHYCENDADAMLGSVPALPKRNETNRSETKPGKRVSAKQQKNKYMYSTHVLDDKKLFAAAVVIVVAVVAVFVSGDPS